MMRVPFLDLTRIHKPLGRSFHQVLLKAIKNSRFVGGEEVESFEREFAEFCGTKYSVGVSSGTDALRLALLAGGVKPGDTVITCVNTFFATVEAIVQAGCDFVLVDISPKSGMIDLGDLDRKITAKTRAIIPVHLFGHAAPMKEIMSMARSRNMMVIEDACQAHGAFYRKQMAGTFGNLGCFSFYPGKNLGALGEGGAVVTNNKKYAQTLKKLRDHGQDRKYYHSQMGYNARLDSIQAGFLRIKLKKLKQWNESRRKIASAYNRQLSHVGEVKTVSPSHGVDSVWHLYVVMAKHRNRLARFLNERGIQTGLHYPIPIHLQKICQGKYAKGDFPGGEEMARTMLSLPIFPGMTQKEVSYVTKNIKMFFSNSKACR
jgi:dTDP-4-amino-4,6-dideoxygalactose transaminase